MAPSKEGTTTNTVPRCPSSFVPSHFIIRTHFSLAEKRSQAFIQHRQQQMTERQKGYSAVNSEILAGEEAGELGEEEQEEEEGEEAGAVVGKGREGRRTEGGGGAAAEDALEIIHSVFPLGGRPFSALNRELVPQYFDQPQELFDEFGFRLPDEPNEDGRLDPTEERRPLESSSHRMRWLAMVESAHSQSVEDELIWAKVNGQKMRDLPRFTQLLHSEGIPHSLRPFLWPKLSGASEKRRNSPCTYAKIARQSEREGVPAVNVQIEKDLLRSMPTHFCFARPHSLGVAPLRRVLRSLAFLFPEIGYCQGMGVVAASLLLVCCEENTFWMLCALIELILPSSYYSPSLLGVKADERVLRHLIQVHMPELLEGCKETPSIFINWLITLLASAFPARLLFRIWDHLFSFGSITIFRIILALLKLGEGRLMERRVSWEASFSDDLFNAICRLPKDIERAEDLLEMAQSFEYSVTDHLITELRRKFQRSLMAEIGLIGKSSRAKGGDESNEENLPKQTVSKRKMYRSKSIVRRIFDKKGRKDQSGGEEDDPRTKNICQTERVLDLRNAILQICAHFAECQEEQHRGREVETQPNYADGFDGPRERQQFLQGKREGHKRGRALIDFEQRDEDDLGFKRNDVITIVSEKDEHCWVGELEGRRGWFPAKFVQVIDERGKHYCARGDEAVCPRIAELVRGPLAYAFHQILCHGFRSSHQTSSSSASTPWTFIESIVTAMSSSVPSQSAELNNRTKCQFSGGTANATMNLCNTFHLDRDSRILRPDQLLQIAVRTIHRSHFAVNAPADAKLRSLVAFGLNEQCLHLWFDILCNDPAHDAFRQRHFRSWSFIRSPVSKQISCELKLLAQFAFNLDIDSEIVNVEELAKSAEMDKDNNRHRRAEEDRDRGGRGEQCMISREGVQDMMIKHHLFSWDL